MEMRSEQNCLSTRLSEIFRFDSHGGRIACHGPRKLRVRNMAVEN